MTDITLDLSQTHADEKLTKLMAALDTQQSVEVSDLGGLLSLLPQLPLRYQTALKAYSILGADHDQKLKLVHNPQEQQAGCCGSCACRD